MSPIRPADAVVVVLATIFVVATAALAWRPTAPGVTAVIASVSQEPVTVALGEPRFITVAGRLGDSVFEVRDGSVRFREAPCRNRVCLAAGWLRNDGDFAACIPNGVTVSVSGPVARYDSINY